MINKINVKKEWKDWRLDKYDKGFALGFSLMFGIFGLIMFLYAPIKFYYGGVVSVTGETMLRGVILLSILLVGWIIIGIIKLFDYHYYVEVDNNHLQRKKIIGRISILEKEIKI